MTAEKRFFLAIRQATPPRHFWRALLLVTALASLALGWHLRWLLDDAFISFRYAWNLVHGHGLVFNPGESPPVEGYTTFLWTLLSAVPIALGIDPAAPMMILSLACAACTLLATWLLARRCLPGEWQPWLAVVVVGFNYSFLCFAATTLETQLQAALVSCGLVLASTLPERGWPTSTSVKLSLCAAAALLNRLDGAIPFGVIAVWLVVRMLRSRAGSRVAALRLGILGLPVTLVVGAWLVWKLGYYGELLPNTWYARDAGISQFVQWRRGMVYVGSFLADYWFAPVLVLVLVRPRLWRDPVYTLGAATFFAWALYVVHAGADYMEYRFMVVALPPLVVTLLGAANALHRAAVPLVVAGFLTAAWLEARANDGSPLGHGRLDPAPLERAAAYYARLGDRVRALPGGDSIVFTLPQLGVPGYYSRLPIIDTHGLTDAWVARHGLVRDESPGHDKFAPVEYLRRRGVNLAQNFGQRCYWYFYYDDLTNERLVVFEGRLFWYVTPHPAIEGLIESGEARVRPMPPPTACQDELRARHESKRGWLALGEGS